MNIHTYRRKYVIPSKDNIDVNLGYHPNTVSNLRDTVRMRNINNNIIMELTMDNEILELNKQYPTEFLNSLRELNKLILDRFHLNKISDKRKNFNDAMHEVLTDKSFIRDKLIDLLIE